ncbi:hypothetical protein C8Q76DRAFT_792778 [Earliella scabrosa]|nr:hypothetical protein C8Q76DRAFT_792778 [Earliella scabrosa]
MPALVIPPVEPSLGAALVGQWLSFLYYYLVTSFGHAEALGEIIISLTLVIPTVAGCILCCQFIYVRRVYIILPDRFKLPFVLSVIFFVIDGQGEDRDEVLLHDLTELSTRSPKGAALVFAIKLFINNTFEEFLKCRWLLSVAFGPSAALDVFVAGVLSIALHKQRNGLRRTNALVDTLILYGFTTGIVTSIMSVGCLMVDLFEGDHLSIIPMALVTAKVYANSVLLTLNLRNSFQEMLNETYHSDGPAEWIGMSGIQTTSRRQEQTTRDHPNPVNTTYSNLTLKFRMPGTSDETDITRKHHLATV